MLETLRIRNLALIDDVELDFCPGLNVLTGESGAGKSFILRALDFILGERISASLVRPGRDKAVVEAVFILDQEPLLLRRELHASSGRSKLFINDDLGSQERLAEFRPRLLMHTSQHGHQRLLSPEHHVDIVDAFLPDPDVLAVHQACREHLHTVLAQRQAVEQRMAGLVERREFLEFQLADIRKVDPRPGEEEELLRQRDSSKEYEQTRTLAFEAQGLILGEGGLPDLLSALERACTGLVSVDANFLEHAASVTQFREGLGDIGRDLRAALADRSEAIDMERIE
ncbi:MAG: AAA family ATPase, partial [Desulfovibrionales bacterium]|nr:AAA family ATPase [Desulfovibrionales bacterium]